MAEAKEEKEGDQGEQLSANEEKDDDTKIGACCDAVTVSYLNLRSNRPNFVSLYTTNQK